VRLPRLKRASETHLPGFRLTPRDRAIIQAVYQFRLLSTPQIEALFFASPGQLTAPSSTRCQHRLKLLYHYGFLERREQLVSLVEGRKSLVYFLAERGAELAAEMQGIPLDRLDWRPSHNAVGQQHLEHLLATNDVRIAITLAAQLHSWLMPVWLDERVLKSYHAEDYVFIAGPRGGQRRVTVVPDGYFVLDVLKPKQGLFFLEVDRRTETVSSRTWSRRDWVRRTQAYLAYYQSGGFTKRYGAHNLRVLTVTTGERHLQSMKAAAERAGDSRIFWFSTFNQATDPNLVLTAPIWQVAGQEGQYCLTD